MIEITDKAKCCGCTACKSCCPVGCISMQTDDEGFKYPKINTGRCINCGMCEKVCPVLSPPALSEELPDTVIARTSNDELLNICTSGGVFTSLARECIKQGGISFGAVYDKDFRVVHMGVEDIKAVEKLAGSKYVQSDIGAVFTEIREQLVSGRNVLFCGTPCQAAGLRNYLKKPYENLFVVDLVCHGVPSPKLWDDYLEYLKEKHGKLKGVNFRSKKLGYHVSVMEERFENGKVRIGSARSNLMSKCFFKNTADRPICYECPFKTISRCSDITIYDSWHAEEICPEIKDDDRGYTCVIIQNDQGKKLIEKFGRDLIYYKADTLKAVKLDGKMALRSVDRPQMRDEFYDLLNEYGIEETVNKLFPISKTDLCVEKLKVFLNVLGILKLAKKLKK